MPYLVLGAGISGCGAAALLRHKKQETYLCDDRPPAAATRERLIGLGVKLLAVHEARSLLSPTCEALVISPGVSLQHPLIVAATQKNVPIISEIDLALQFYTGKLIGITGTNGKSTIAAMTYHLLLKAGKNAALAGNIGISLCQYFADHSPPEILVLELSSYQLEVSKRIHADVGVIVNLTPDHLERHHTEENYYGAKWRLFSAQKPGAAAIITEEAYKICQGFGFPTPPSTLHIITPAHEEQVLPFSVPEISSRHNRQNAALATLAVSLLIDQPIATVGPLIAGYQGLPYRYQIIARRSSVSVINDSKGTNLHATLTAIESSKGKIILMLGGRGKGESFLPVLAYKNRISRIIAFGYSGAEVSAQLNKEIKVTLYSTLKEALDEERFSVNSLPCSLLFSPACASFDEFANFEERGKFFNKYFA
jgi:UDP-N-acetylmuramoylalanine--D-glutamate ligase